MALVLLELLGLLLVSAARTVAWRGQLDRMTTRASTLVMAVSDSGPLPQCASAPSNAGTSMAESDGTGVTMTRADERLPDAVASHGTVTLPLTRGPRSTSASSLDAPPTTLPWHAAWWCPH